MALIIPDFRNRKPEHGISADTPSTELIDDCIRAEVRPEGGYRLILTVPYSDEWTSEGSTRRDLGLTEGNERSGFSIALPISDTFCPGYPEFYLSRCTNIKQLSFGEMQAIRADLEHPLHEQVSLLVEVAIGLRRSHGRPVKEEISAESVVQELILAIGYAVGALKVNHGIPLLLRNNRFEPLRVRISSPLRRWEDLTNLRILASVFSGRGIPFTDLELQDMRKRLELEVDPWDPALSRREVLLPLQQFRQEVIGKLWPSRQPVTASAAEAIAQRLAACQLSIEDYGRLLFSGQQEDDPVREALRYQAAESILRTNKLARLVLDTAKQFGATGRVIPQQKGEGFTFSGLIRIGQEESRITHSHYSSSRGRNEAAALLLAKHFKVETVKVRLRTDPPPRRKKQREEVEEG